MMTNTKEQGKQKYKNQKASLRETRNSILDEQSKEPQHLDKSKRVRWHKAYRISNEFSVSILIYIIFHSNTSSENNYPKLKHNEKEPRKFSHDKRPISSFFLISMMKDHCYLFK